MASKFRGIIHCLPTVTNFIDKAISNAKAFEFYLDVSARISTGTLIILTESFSNFSQPIHKNVPIPVSAPSKAWVFAGIVG